MNNLFVFAKEKSVNHRVKETFLSQQIVNQSETNLCDKETVVSLEILNKTAQKIKIPVVSLEMVNETTSKIKIKLKNPILEVDYFPSNISSDDIYSNQYCQKKILGNALDTLETKNIIKKKVYECLDCEFTTTKKSTYDNHLISKKHYINTNNIQPYLCQYCNINQINKSNYIKHIKNIHNIDTNQLTYKGYYLIELDKKKVNLTETHYKDEISLQN